jgi:hypothetical protein
MKTRPSESPQAGSWRPTLASPHCWPAAHNLADIEGNEGFSFKLEQFILECTVAMYLIRPAEISPDLHDPVLHKHPCCPRSWHDVSRLGQV